MEDLLPRIMQYGWGILGAFGILGWYTLRLYIKDEIHGIKDYLVAEFGKLHGIYESKEAADLKYDSIQRQLGRKGTR